MKTKLFSLFVVIFSISWAGDKEKPKQGFEKQNKQTVSFRENLGQVSDQYFQARPDVLFSGTAGAMNFHLKKTGIAYQLTHEVANDDSTTQTDYFHSELLSRTETEIYRIDVSWLDCNPSSSITKGAEIGGYDNFYLPVCPNGILGVKSYEKVTYNEIYSGIDLKWYQKEGNLKYDYLVAPGADYSQIKLKFSGVSAIHINTSGQLELVTPMGTLTEEAPVVFQNGATLPSNWVVDGTTVSFHVEGYNPSLPMIIDPTIRQWGTYYGGTGAEHGYGLATFSTSAVFLSGYTNSSTSIATAGAHQITVSGADAFVTKFNSSGVRQWGTYYGGSDSDYGYDCGVDGSGNVYIAGETDSETGIATVGQTAFGGASDSFVIKFNTSGTRVWGTYMGGSSTDRTYGIAVSSSGETHICGYTESDNGVALSGHQMTRASSGIERDAFAVKINASGTKVWGTYYGGIGEERSYNLAVDGSGNVFLSGYSAGTSNISTAGAHQVSNAGGQDAFLAKFNSSGTRQWGTYFGGSGNDYSDGLSTDASGNIYMSGATYSTTGISGGSPSPWQASNGGGQDAFLAKFNTSGTRIWATYVGGSGTDLGRSSCVVASGNVAITGETSSTGMATSGSYQTALGSGVDAFILEFDCNTGQRESGTYYGGSGSEYGYTVAVDGVGDVYLAGWTDSPNNMATAGSHQAVISTGTDAFLVKFTNVSLGNQVNNFESVCSSEAVLFSWESEAETNVSYYEVQEVTADGIRPVDKITAFGTSNTSKNYSLQSTTSSDGIYQLAVVNMDGSASITNPISVDCKTPTKETGFSSSYSNRGVVINFDSPAQSTYQLNIIDIQGKIIYSSSISAEKGDNKFQISNLFHSTGLYMISLSTENDLQVNKLIVPE